MKSQLGGIKQLRRASRHDNIRRAELAITGIRGTVDQLGHSEGPAEQACKRLEGVRKGTAA